jgi:hypothetical protein
MELYLHSSYVLIKHMTYSNARGVRAIPVDMTSHKFYLWTNCDDSNVGRGQCIIDHMNRSRVIQVFTLHDSDVHVVPSPHRIKWHYPATGTGLQDALS